MSENEGAYGGPQDDGPPHSDGDSDDDGWADEESSSCEQTVCLFCPLQFLTIAVALDHCRTAHNFNLLELKSRFNMDFHSYIKMINYIRMHKPDPKILTGVGGDGEGAVAPGGPMPVAIWDDDVYLKPIGEMESWLMYDFDDLGSAPSTPHYAIDGKTPISNLNFCDLQRQIQDLTLQLRHKDMLLENAMNDIARMKEVTREIFDAEDAIMKDSPPSDAGCDNEYFNSYSHFGIHHDMLNDRVRTKSYHDAILNNADVFKGKTVLDLGCGTGILSLFSAKAGASKVYGIDQSEVVYQAMGIVRENGMHETIELIKGRVETTQLPVDKVDIIVSEWMGYFLLFEGMLDSFVFARDDMLRPGGQVLPSRCSLHLMGCSDAEAYDKRINFWNDVYGFSMKSMKEEVLCEAYTEIVPSEKIITDSVCLKEIDLRTCTKHTCEFTSKFSFKVNKTASLTSLVGYFDTFFDLPNPVEFSTGPLSERTHWQQTVFYLKHTIDVKEGDIVEGTLTCSRLEKNPRGLSVIIAIDNKKYEYYLD